MGRMRFVFGLANSSGGRNANEDPINGEWTFGIRSVYAEISKRADRQGIFKNMTDFSIDYILNRAGDKYMGTNCCVGLSDRIKLNASPELCESFKNELIQSQLQECHQQYPMFDWLQYTRYHPPKLPRPFRTGPVKRTPGRLPRVPFSPAQLQALENAYKISTYLSSEDANNLAMSLDLTNTRVKIWFQNRRARERREKRERSADTGCDSTMSSTSSSPEPEMISIG